MRKLIIAAACVTLCLAGQPTQCEVWLSGDLHFKNGVLFGLSMYALEADGERMSLLYAEKGGTIETIDAICRDPLNRYVAIDDAAALAGFIVSGQKIPKEYIDLIREKGYRKYRAMYGTPSEKR